MEPGSKPLVRQVVPFLRVADLAASLRFYVDGLGFAVGPRWPQEETRWCWLQRDGAALMLQDRRRDDGGRWDPPGAVGLGVSLVFMCDDAIAVYRDAHAKGLHPTRPFVSNGLWLTSLADPDGYRVDFQSPTETPEGSEYDPA